MQGREKEEADIHLLLNECLEVILDLLATDDLAGYLGAVVPGPEREADDCSWKGVLILHLLEPREVQGPPNLGWDIFQHQLHPVEEIALGVKHDHGVPREHLRIVCDLEGRIKDRRMH